MMVTQTDFTVRDVSVVIPAYGNAEMLNQAVASAVGQTAVSVEIVVVDDCSPEDVVSAYRLPAGARLVRHDRRSGPAAARNTGVREAVGRYIAFMDMDDVWKPEKLQAHLELLDSDPEAGMVFCHYTLVDEFLNALPFQPDVPALKQGALRALMIKNVIKSCSVVTVRRDVFCECGGFDETLLGTDDWDLWIKIASKRKVIQDPVPWVLYRTHSGQLSSDSLLMREGAVRVRERWLPHVRTSMPDLELAVRFRLAWALQRLALCEARAGKTNAAFTHVLGALRYCPWDLRCYYSLLAVLAHAVVKA